MVYLHVRRQSLHRHVELLLHVEDDLAGVGAVAHHHDAADGFSFAVQLGDAAPHVGAEFDVGDLAEENRHAFVAHAHGHFAQVVQALHVTLDAQDEFLFRQFDGTPADLAVAALDGHRHVGNGKVVGAQFGGVHRDLVLLDEAADGGDFRNAFHRGQLVAQIPVLHRAQLRRGRGWWN